MYVELQDIEWEILSLLMCRLSKKPLCAVAKWLQAADKVRGAGGSSPCRGLGQSPKALCRSIFRERCKRPKGARNAALPKIRGFSTV